MLSEDGRLFGFGARMNGQLDGLNYGKLKTIFISK